MTTNTNEPLFIKMPVDESTNKLDKNMIAILPNENAEGSILSKYNTTLAITSDGIVGEEKDGSEIRIIKYEDWSFIVTEESILKVINSLLPFLLIFIVIGLVPLVILFIFIVAMLHLVWLFFVALLIWGFLRLKKLNISYKQSYKIGMYAVVPLLSLEIIISPLNLSGRLLTTVIILLIVLIVTHDWQKEEIPLITIEEKSA